MNFEGSCALVTGASSGIGEMFARELVERGANLVLVARSQDKLEALAEQLRDRSGVSVDALACDLSEPGAGAVLAARLAERGVRIDVLVNSAGFGLFGQLHEADTARTSQQVQLNVTALTELTCALLPQMCARNCGTIVNVASTAAFQPLPYMAVYAATKAYVLSFTEALWAETRGTAVRVTAICPGATDTAFFDTASEHASVGRRMAPEQVVAAAFSALERRRCSVIPGVRNRLLAAAPRLTPRQTVVRISERTMRPKISTPSMTEPQPTSKEAGGDA
jgi:short-subunit dehydrogenase